MEDNQLHTCNDRIILGVAEETEVIPLNIMDNFSQSFLPVVLKGKSNEEQAMELHKHNALTVQKTLMHHAQSNTSN